MKSVKGGHGHSPAGKDSIWAVGSSRRLYMGKDYMGCGLFP